MAKDKKNIAEMLLSPAGDMVRGFFRGIAPGMAEQHDLTKEQMRTQNEQRQISNLQSNINSQLKVLQIGFDVANRYGGMGQPEGKEAFRNTLTQLGYPDMAEKFASLSVGKQQQPKGLSNDVLKTLKTIYDIKSENIDITKNENAPDRVTNQRLDDILNQTIDSLIGTEVVASTGQPKQKVTLADMLAGYSQDTDRKGWFWNFGDDTISPDNVKAGAKNYVELQKAQGVDEKQARKQATKEYADLMAKDSGNRQKYPKMDIAQLFVNEDTRKQAVDSGKNVVVNTGDGVDTTVDTYSKLGIQDPDIAEQFADLEAITGKSIPDFDLRADYKKDPEFYKKLLTAIREGVPDSKNPGQKRKLSVQEIIDLIRG